MGSSHITATQNITATNITTTRSSSRDARAVPLSPDLSRPRHPVTDVLAYTTALVAAS